MIDIEETEEESGFGWGYILTREHFLYFVAAGKSWLNYFHISDWDITFNFVEADEDDPRAMTHLVHFGNRLGSINLYDHWDRSPTDYNLWIVAFHEVVEVLLGDLHVIAQSREYDAESHDREHHRVIRILEKTLFEGMWEDGHDIFNFQTEPEIGRISRPDISRLAGRQPSLHDRGLRSDEPEPGGRTNRISPLQRIKGWRDKLKTARSSLRSIMFKLS